MSDRGVADKPEELQRHRRSVLESQHHLEDGRVAQTPPGRECLDQLLERQLLMRVGAEGDLTSPPQQLPKRRVAGEIGAQGQGVDEESDEAFEFAGACVPAIGEPTTRSRCPLRREQQGLEAASRVMNKVTPSRRLRVGQRGGEVRGQDEGGRAPR